jgi:hypothetical protein
MKKKLNIEIKKPKADIFFVDPWIVLEPYPEICNFKDSLLMQPKGFLRNIS